MKKLFVFYWILFLAAILLKFFHMPGSSLLLIVATGSMVIHSLIYLAIYGKKDIEVGLMYVSSALISLYMLFRLQYWPDAMNIFWTAAGVTVGWLIVCFMRKKPFTWRRWLLTAYFALFIAISFIRSYKLFEVFHREVFARNDAEVYYRVWDTYSRLLEAAGKYDEALVANQKCIEALEKGSTYAEADAPMLINEMKERELLIRERALSDTKP